MYLGLSPRVRGNHNRTHREIAMIRSIPARAGEPRSASGRSSHSRVYPRACGGTEQFKAAGYQMLGLSPRVRGNRDDFREYYPHGGSIPARAGEPTKATSVQCRGRVYPRACGGTARPMATEWARGGLSPRVRGNLTCSGWKSKASGSIPARAGEPAGFAGTDWRCPVYPRACGGTLRIRNRPTSGQGLSPRVRGNPLAN